jgi:hypothetical protein
MIAVMTMAATVTRPSTAHAVEYVRVCDLFGPGFFYLPGTNTCVDVATNDASESTAGGTWQWRIPNNPVTWSPTPLLSCIGGQLVKFGDINSSGLILNSYSRYQTQRQYRLRLRPGQYISSILYQGGFTGVGGTGNFCMYYYDAANNAFSFPPLGCIDTSPQAGTGVTLMFSPDVPTPPASISQPNLIGANGEAWNITSPADIQGTLSVWLCLKTAIGGGLVH